MVRIAHCADIHIDDRRREEYALVFAKFYESLKKEKPDIIVVAGDVFNVKAHATPHNLEDVSSFLVNLVGIAPVILTTGNHDVDVHKPGSLDLLSPLVTYHRLLQPPNLTYLRHSGTYAVHGIVWTVIATDGAQPSRDSEQKAIDDYGLASAPHICLFHEELNGALFANGMQIKDFSLTKESLKRYDVVMGGHIHLRQQFTARGAYCGSLVQQNIGEARSGHGYVLWSLDMATAGSAKHLPYRIAEPEMKGIDIPNPHGFVRIEIDANGSDVTRGPLPDEPLYWELIYDAAAPRGLVNELDSEYTTLFAMPHRAIREKPRPGHSCDNKVEEKEIEQVKTAESKTQNAMIDAQLESRNLESHESLMRKLLKDKPADLIEKVIAMHKTRYNEPGQHDYIGARLRILRIEFDNFKSYGEKNVVDFTLLEKTVSGVIAENSAGKSSFIEAIVFALYDLHPRARVKADLIRIGAPYCRVLLNFELDGKPGSIDKWFSIEQSHSATSGRSGINRYRFTYDGEDRTKGDVAGTLAAIREVVGAGDDALISSFQMQKDDIRGFITASTASARKELLADAFSVGNFKSLRKSVKAEIKQCSDSRKSLEGEAGKTAAELEHLCDKESGDAEDLRSKIVDLSADVEALNARKLKLTEEYGVASAKLAISSDAAKLALQKFPHFQERYTEVFCRANVEAWERAIGAVGDEIQNAPVCLLPEAPNVPTHIPSHEMVTESATDIIAAEQDLAKKEANEQKCALALAGAPPPKMSVADALMARQRAQQILANAKGEVLAQNKPVAPDPVVGMLPGATLEITGERNGSQPDEATLNAAISLLSTRKAHTSGLVLPRWDEKQHARLQGIANRELPTNARPRSQLESELQAAEIAAAAADRSCAEAKTEFEISSYAHTPVIQELREKCNKAKSWVAVAGHVDVIRGRLRPEKNCVGCVHTASVLDSCEPAEAKANLKLAEEELSAALQKAKEIAQYKLDEAVRNCETTRERLKKARENRVSIEDIQDEKEAALRSVQELELARDIELEQAALGTIETANYHYMRRVEAWSKYEAQLISWEANSAAGIKHAEKQLADVERAEKNNKVADTEHTVAKEAMFAATAEIAAARETVKAAHQTYNKLYNERAKALLALQWWKCAEMTAKAKAEEMSYRSAAEVCVKAIQSINQSYKLSAKKLLAAQEQAAATEDRAKKAQADLEKEQKRVSELNDVKEKHEVLIEYKEMISTKRGVGHILLTRIKSSLEQHLNNALRELGATFRARIDADFAVQITNRLQEWVQIYSGGGYESFAVGLAARLAVWRLAVSPRPDAIIIDEGFTSCEEAKLEEMATAIESLVAAPDGPRLLFIVTHLPKLKMSIERALEIKLLPTGSQITNATATLMAVPIGPVAKKEAAPKTEQKAGAARIGEALPPDSDNPGKFYCKVCSKSLTSGRVAIHLASKGHLEKVTKSKK